jgi:cysteinyl-tRNA synthetase
MKLFNSLSREVGEFKPIKEGRVGMYTCGPTVYDYDHIGHAWKYVHDDLLRRLLTYNGYEVKHVQNITDVGHLVSDADEGEDKLEKGALKSGKTVWDVANYYTDAHFSSMDKLNILRPHVSCKATEHIAEQIELVEKLVKKGFAYDTPEAVYFDVEKFPRYSSLFGLQNLEEKKVAVRDEVQTGKFKKHPSDFSLWFKRVGRFENHTMHWDSPWGDGFPGWHIECSAMAMKYLGESFDIHTGGIDHLPVHHPNEIAQSEAATGKVFARYWIHYSHVMVDGTKMSKSLGNFYRVEEVIEKGFSPLALRYLYLTASYRSNLNFTWSALAAAQSAYDRLKEFVRSTRHLSDSRVELSNEKLKKVDGYRKRFMDAVNDDMNFAAGLAVVWEMLKSNVPNYDKLDLLLDWDQILGLGLDNIEETEVPEEIKKLGADREGLRLAGRYIEADELRMEIEKKGWILDDTKSGTRYKKITNAK